MTTAGEITPVGRYQLKADKVFAVLADYARTITNEGFREFSRDAQHEWRMQFARATGWTDLTSMPDEQWMLYWAQNKLNAAAGAAIDRGIAQAKREGK